MYLSADCQSRSFFCLNRFNFKTFASVLFYFSLALSKQNTELRNKEYSCFVIVETMPENDQAVAKGAKKVEFSKEQLTLQRCKQVVTSKYMSWVLSCPKKNKHSTLHFFILLALQTQSTHTSLSLLTSSKQYMFRCFVTSCYI